MDVGGTGPNEMTRKISEECLGFKTEK